MPLLSFDVATTRYSSPAKISYPAGLPEIIVFLGTATQLLFASFTSTVYSIVGAIESGDWAVPVDVAPFELKLKPVAVTVLRSLTVGSVIETTPVPELSVTPDGSVSVVCH